MNKYSYTIKWTQPYRIDCYYHSVYNQKEQLIERLLKDNQMLEANQLIDRIKLL